MHKQCTSSLSLFQRNTDKQCYVGKEGGSLCIVCAKNSRHVYQPPVGPQNLKSRTAGLNFLCVSPRAPSPFSFSSSFLLFFILLPFFLFLFPSLLLHLTSFLSLSKKLKLQNHLCVLFQLPEKLLFSRPLSDNDSN